MKKQLIAVVSALAMTFTSLPCVSIAAENVPKPVLQYTFDGNKQLADQNGKNELKLSGGASVTDDGNKGKGLLLDGTDGYAELPDNILSSDMTITTWVKIINSQHGAEFSILVLTQTKTFSLHRTAAVLQEWR